MSACWYTDALKTQIPVWTLVVDFGKLKPKVRWPECSRQKNLRKKHLQLPRHQYTDFYEIETNYKNTLIP